MIKKSLSILFDFINNNALIKKVLSNFNFLLFEKIVRILIKGISFILLARYLGQRLFGIYNYIISYVSLFLPIVTLGIDTIVIKKIIQSKKDVGVILGSSFVLSFVSGALVIILSASIFYFINKSTSALMIYVLIITSGYLFKSLDIFEYYFQAKLKNIYTASIRIINYILFFLLFLFFIFMNLSIAYFFLLFTVELIIIGICYLFLFLIKEKDILSKLKVKFSCCIQVLKESFPLAIASMMIILYMRIDQIMLKNLISASEVGIYAAAVRIIELWYIIPMIAGTIVYPILVDFKKQNLNKYNSSLNHIYFLMTWSSIIVALLFTILSNQIVDIFYGKEYIRSSIIISLSAWAGIFVSQGIIRGKWLVIENLQKYSMIYIGAALINIVLNYILIPKFASIGASIATLISYFFSSIVIPALFRETRISTIHFLKSFNIVKYIMIGLNIIKKRTAC